MSQKEETRTDLAPLNIIRSETVFSRYPLHRLAKKGNPDIEIRRSNERGEVTFRWEISHNSRYGQPGPLAYKIDTLVVNRRIEETGKPVPTLICLGSLKDISDQLGKAETRDTDTIKKALHQNAATYITAKLTYQNKEGRQRQFEFGGTRYNVVFTGEKLPDGTRANAVYLVLHDVYRELLNTSPVRPLDYDYLKDLPSMAQRFYELLSYQIFAVLENDRPRAKYLYSDFCTYAPQTRYYEYDKVKKQMFKVHAPHRQAGYIAKAEFEETTDHQGQRDWLMLYTPGPKAQAEHKAFSKKGRYAGQLAEPPSEEASRQLVGEGREVTAATQADDEKLLQQLRGLHISERTARLLITNHRGAVVTQLEALPYRDRSSIRDLSAWLIKAIKGDFEIPLGFADIKAKEAARALDEKEKITQKARESHRELHQEAFSRYLHKQLELLRSSNEEAFNAFNEQASRMDAVLNHLEPKTRETVRFADFEQFAGHYPELGILTFWQWDEQLNTKPFVPSVK